MQAGGTNFSGTGQFKFALVSPGTNVSRQATAAAAVTGGFVTAINVIDGGGGYTGTPAVIITDPTGSGAVAVAQVSGGVVTSIVVQNAGSGYSAAPAVTIAPPPLTIVHGTFWSNDGTSSAGSEPAGSVPVQVQQGLFTVFLGDTNLPNMQPVPAGVFTQPGVYLRLWFSDGMNGFAQLAPGQRVGSVGYAFMAAVVSAGGVSGAALATGSVTSAKIENGAILVEDMSLSLLNGAFWNLSGNSGTTPGTHFLGTTDNQPLELKVNGARALRLEPNTDNQPNLVGGSALNFVAPGIVGATIGGGGTEHFGGGAGFASTNSVMADFGSIGGGLGNRIGTGATRSTIAGGFSNDIGAGSVNSTVGGGNDNNIASNTLASTISGGQRNDIGERAHVSAIGGGEGNEIGTNSLQSTIGGGVLNRIGANSPYATIPGGANNFATNRAFAAGTRARANHSGAFVWGDSSNADMASTNANSVTMRASGGYRLFSNSGATLGVFLAAGGNSWAAISDRNAKKNFQAVDSASILEKLVHVPIEHWNYKSEADDSVPHLGPMAQEFKAAFYPGRDDKSISTLEFDGVALAAIQGLNQKLSEELKRRDTQNAELKQRLEKLEQLMNRKLNGGVQ